MGYDHIIVGGGSAGAVLAARLSEQSRRSVLLIEAGQDTPPGAEPADVLDTYHMSAYRRPYLWPNLLVHFGPRPHNRPEAQPSKPYDQGRVMGGGSSVNAMVAIRGAPLDFAEWEALGAKGWGWADVLPYFNKLEKDVDFAGPEHGTQGPIPCYRRHPEDWPGIVTAAGQAAEGLGFGYYPDLNTTFEDGYFMIARSATPEHRVSSAIGYLTPEVRARDNLTILPDTSVAGLLSEGRRITGVSLAGPGGVRDVLAGEVILSAGAIQSPAILMRAGIGPADHLGPRGIEVLADLPVGKNLQEHPMVSVAAHIRPEGRQDRADRPGMSAGMRYSSGLEGCPDIDMFLLFSGKSGWHAMGHAIQAIPICVYKPFSVGEVTLKSTDPAQDPLIEFNMLSDRRDLDRLKHGMRFVHRLYQQEPLARLSTKTFAASYSGRVRALGKVTLSNRLKAATAATIMDRSALFRDLLIDKVISPGLTLAQLLADDEALEEWVIDKHAGFWHASCTCRMGAPGDAKAVTDPQGRVLGIGGLRVVDASIMPAVVRANTNISTIMMAEKIAEQIKAETDG